MKWFYLFLLIMNVTTYQAFALDKVRAEKGQWRISESRLLLLALFGGGFGGWRGMMDYRHKTGKMKFKILIPLFFLLQISGLLYVYWHGLMKDTESMFYLSIALVIHVLLFALLRIISSKRKRR